MFANLLLPTRYVGWEEILREEEMTSSKLSTLKDQVLKEDQGGFKVEGKPFLSFDRHK